MTIKHYDAPRAFRHPECVAARRLMLHEPHIAPLTAYVEGLRARYPGWEFQEFDPLDGGIGADLLFLLEKPGPMTSPKSKAVGSGFISRNNDDPTAEAIFNFMEQAGIARRRVVLWNVIPGWNGTIKISAVERRAGIEELAQLLKQLPNLKTVVLGGGQAGRAAKHMRALDLRVYASAHPSARVRNRYRVMWERIPQLWSEAGANSEAAANLQTN